MSFLIEAIVKPSSLQAFAHRPALVRSKCGFENRIKNTFFIRSVSAYRELLIAAVLVVTIVQHRTSVLDRTACVCSKTSRVDHTKSVHNRPKPTVFVRTAQGLSSNQNEVAINSKSGLWRTALIRLFANDVIMIGSVRADWLAPFGVTIGNPRADKLGRNGFECIGRRWLVDRERCVRATFMHNAIDNYSMLHLQRWLECRGIKIFGTKSLFMIISHNCQSCMCRQ